MKIKIKRKYNDLTLEARNKAQEESLGFYFLDNEKKAKRIAELEKENAILKKQQFSLRNERNTFLAQNEQYEKDLIDFNENLTEAKEIMQKLVANAPDTYSGTNIELQQKKMFSFQDAVNKAEYFLNSEVKE